MIDYITYMNKRIIENWIKAAGSQGAVKLSALAEVSPGTLHRILSKDHEPTLDVIRKLAAVLGVSITTLIGEDIEPEVIKQA